MPQRCSTRRALRSVCSTVTTSWTSSRSASPRDVHVPARRISLDKRRCSPRRVRERRLVRADDRATLEREFPDSAAMLPAARAVGGRGSAPRGRQADTASSSSSSTARTRSTTSSPRSRRRPRASRSRRSSARGCTSGSARPARRSTASSRSRHASTAEYRRGGRPRRSAARRGRPSAPTTACSGGSDDGVLELLRSDPRRDEWPPGLRVPLADFPGLEDAVASLGVSFVPDVLAEARGDGLERVRAARHPLVAALADRHRRAGGARARRFLADGRRPARSDDDRDRPALRRSGGPGVRAARAAAGRRQGGRARGRDRAAAGGHGGALARGDAAATSATPAWSTRCEFVGAEAGFVVLTGAGRHLGADDLELRATRTTRSRLGAPSASTPTSRSRARSRAASPSGR